MMAMLSRLRRLFGGEKVLVLGPDGWAEVPRILDGKSTEDPKVQAFVLWLAWSGAEELLQYPANVKQMATETGLGGDASQVAQAVMQKMKDRYRELTGKEIDHDL